MGAGAHAGGLAPDRGGQRIRDGSGGIASRLGAEVVVEHRRGFGAACFRGLQTATSEIVCFMDGDGSLDPASSQVWPLLSLPEKPTWFSGGGVQRPERGPCTLELPTSPCAPSSLVEPEFA